MKEQAVIVASKNPVKGNAALDGFQRLFPDDAFTILSLVVNYGIPDQPMTDEEIM